MDTPSSTPTANGAINTAADKSQKVVDRVAQSAHDTVDRVAAAAGPAIEKLRTTASSAGDTIQAKADQFGALEEQWISNARSYVRDHPFTAITIGVLAGMLIGRMGGSRNTD